MTVNELYYELSLGRELEFSLNSIDYFITLKNQKDVKGARIEEIYNVKDKK